MASSLEEMSLLYLGKMRIILATGWDNLAFWIQIFLEYM